MTYLITALSIIAAVQTRRPWNYGNTSVRWALPVFTIDSRQSAASPDRRATDVLAATRTTSHSK